MVGFASLSYLAKLFHFINIYPCSFWSLALVHLFDCRSASEASCQIMPCPTTNVWGIRWIYCTSVVYTCTLHGPLAMNLRVTHALWMPGTFFFTPPRVSDPGMHHDTCVVATWQEPHPMLITTLNRLKKLTHHSSHLWIYSNISTGDTIAHTYFVSWYYFMCVLPPK